MQLTRRDVDRVVFVQTTAVEVEFNTGVLYSGLA